MSRPSIMARHIVMTRWCASHGGGRGIGRRGRRRQRLCSRIEEHGAMRHTTAVTLLCSEKGAGWRMVQRGCASDDEVDVGMGKGVRACN